jgi:hypothetical protein
VQTREINVIIRKLTDVQDRPHNDLTDRDAPDCHPISAITDLSANALLPSQTGQVNKFLTTDGSNPYWKALPNNVTNTTYSNLMTMIAGSTLISGKNYMITDFATVHYIVDSAGTQYSINAGTTEPLTVVATSPNTIDKEAKSSTYPQDTIYYDPLPTQWLDDNGFSNSGVIVPGFKGVIYFRYDTLLDNYMGYDFRNVLFRRWNTACTAWTSAISTLAGGHVEHSGFVYKASLNNLSQAQIDTITLTGTSGTATITDAGGLTEIVTFNINIQTTAADFVTAFATDYLAQGIVITSNTTDIIFTANVSGTPFTSPIMTNVSGNLAGTTTNLIPNITPEEPSSFADYWVQSLDLSLTAYWNNNPTSTNGIPSGTSYVDVKTFAEGSGTATYELCCRSNHIEPFKDDLTNDNASGSIINNNVFFLQDNHGFSVYSNQIAAESYGNTTGNSFYSNTIGNSFNTNMIGNSFHTNMIGNDFYSNTTGNDFYSNITGNSFFSNTIGNNFSNNTVENDFYSNTVENDFYSNSIGNNFNTNTVGNRFYSNTTGNDFYSNTIGTDFFENMIGNYFSYNTIGNSFLENTIGNLFYVNTIGNEFYHNTIGNLFANNTTGTNFANNTIGSTFTYYMIGDGFAQNAIGNYSSDNTIGDNFYSNTVAINFLSNTIGDDFVSNTIGNYLVANTIGDDFHYNTIGNYFASNTIADDFNTNTVYDNIRGLDFTSVSQVYDTYSTTIQLRHDEDVVLSYIDDTLTWIIVDITP